MNVLLIMTWVWDLCIRSRLVWRLRVLRVLLNLQDQALSLLHHLLGERCQGHRSSQRKRQNNPVNSFCCLQGIADKYLSLFKHAFCSHSNTWNSDSKHLLWKLAQNFTRRIIEGQSALHDTFTYLSVLKALWVTYHSYLASSGKRLENWRHLYKPRYALAKNSISQQMPLTNFIQLISGQGDSFLGSFDGFLPSAIVKLL